VQRAKRAAFRSAVAIVSEKLDPREWLHLFSAQWRRETKIEVHVVGSFYAASGPGPLTLSLWVRRRMAMQKARATQANQNGVPVARQRSMSRSK